MTQTWIFQANPDRFDIDAFLATRPGRTTWLVTRLGKEMNVGDKAFLWRSIGNGDAANAGVIAEAEIVSGVQAQPDDPKAKTFWKSSTDATSVADRVALRIVRVANKKEVLQRAWLVEDPILRDLEILKLANATNYRVDRNLARRLSVLWDKAGQDWSYAETVAGLWAYLRTYQHEVSKLPDAPVAQVALVIGRSIGSVYNKVMNFRSLDPRDERKGLSGASVTDRAVWAEFFEPSAMTIREALIEAEKTRLWDESGTAVPVDEAEAAERATEKEAYALSSLTLNDLLAAYSRGGGRNSSKPRARRSSTRTFERDALVVAIAKARADFRCEVGGCDHALFIGDSNDRFCEVHHIHPLAEGGEDTPQNVACVCPSHHREAHHGKEAAKLRAMLTALRDAEGKDAP